MRADTTCLLLLDRADDAERVGAALDPQAAADHWHARLVAAADGVVGDPGRVRDPELVDGGRVLLAVDHARDGNDVWTNDLVAFAEELEEAGVPFALESRTTGTSHWQERTPDGDVRYGSGTYTNPDLSFNEVASAVAEAAASGGDPWDVLRNLRGSLPRMSPCGDRPQPGVPHDLGDLVGTGSLRRRTSRAG